MVVPVVDVMAGDDVTGFAADRGATVKMQKPRTEREQEQESDGSRQSPVCAQCLQHLILRRIVSLLTN